MASATHQSLNSNRLDSAYLQAGGFSQANQRRKQRLTDQHGRKYFAVIEIRSGDPVGPIEPMFQAPLVTPAMYLRKHPDAEKPNDVVIDYARWIQDLETAHADRLKRGRELARKHLGSAYDPAEPFPVEIEDLLGPAPQPVEPVYAAMQGNRWVLGYSRRVDLKLAGFFEVEQLNARRGVNLDKYDFRDNDSDTARYADPEASPLRVAAPNLGTSRSTRGEEFDYERAAQGIDDGLDDLDMQLDEDDELEAQFDRDATGGQRVPVGNPPKGQAPKTLRAPSTKHPGVDGEKDRPGKSAPTVAVGAKAKARSHKKRPPAPTAPTAPPDDDELPPAA